MDENWPGRWNHVKKFLERTGPFAHPDFEPSPEVRKVYQIFGWDFPVVQ